MGTTPTRVSTMGTSPSRVSTMGTSPTRGGTTPTRGGTMAMKGITVSTIGTTPTRGGTTLMRVSTMVSNFQRRVFLRVNPNQTFLKRVVRVPIRDSPNLVIFLREINQSFSREKVHLVMIPILLKLIHLIKGKFQMVSHSKLVTRVWDIIRTRVHVSHSPEDKDPFP